MRTKYEIETKISETFGLTGFEDEIVLNDVRDCLRVCLKILKLNKVELQSRVSFGLHFYEGDEFDEHKLISIEILESPAELYLLKLQKSVFRVLCQVDEKYLYKYRSLKNTLEWVLGTMSKLKIILLSGKSLEL